MFRGKIQTNASPNEDAFIEPAYCSKLSKYLNKPVGKKEKFLIVILVLLLTPAFVIADYFTYIGDGCFDGLLSTIAWYYHCESSSEMNKIHESIAFIADAASLATLLAAFTLRKRWLRSIPIATLSFKAAYISAAVIYFLPDAKLHLAGIAMVGISIYLIMSIQRRSHIKGV
jgi:hypothetical protein